ncbi:MAG TPA: universal stress protein [Longimicrobiales bacterium]|nr:universal stress protein [Longimicrobiales bacterium]
MHDLIAQQNIAPPAAHRVLALTGGAPPERLLELARCSTPRGARLELFALHADAAAPVEGADSLLGGAVRVEQPSVREVLRALHDTRADAVVLGYPDHARGRSAFTDIVERATAAASVDVIVCVDRHERPWRRVLVPYLYGPLDSGALGVARRLARTGDAEVTVLHVVEPAGEDDDAVQPLRTRIDGCNLKVVTAGDPVSAAAEEARRGYDLIVLGGRDRLVQGRYFTMRQQRLLLTTDATLVIVHSGRQN